MVQQAIVLTKKGLWYKQMLDTRRSELRKAESEVCFPYLLKLFTSLHSSPSSFFLFTVQHKMVSLYLTWMQTFKDLIEGSCSFMCQIAVFISLKLQTIKLE